MKDETKLPEQKQNRNGNPILVLHDKTKDYQNVVSTTAEAVGVLTNGVKVYDKNNFSWGIYHSKTSPTLSLERLKQVSQFKIYKNNPNTGRTFRGNQYTAVSSIKSATEKVSKVAGVTGDVVDGMQIYDLLKRQDAENLALKSGEFIGGKTGDVVGVKLLGKCLTSSLGKSPTGVVLKGLSCAGAGYATTKLGKHIGKNGGKTNLGLEIAIGIIKADQIITEQEEKERDEYYKKNPRERHWNAGSD